MVTFKDRLSDDNDYKREELIKKIEQCLRTDDSQGT